jgi:hypothetical protein
MPEFSPKRPKVVTVIGWFWTVAGSWMLLKGMLEGASLLLAEAPYEGWFREYAERFPIHAVLYRYCGVVILIEMVTAVVAIVAARQFLRMRRWARTTLEIVSWLSLLWISGFWLLTVVALSAAEAWQPASIAMMAMPVLLHVVLTGAVLSVVIYFLRTQRVRNAVSQRDTKNVMNPSVGEP